ncbi:hypothetical protein BDZ89DRAFT_974903, partial [Hymenopellis radicata]
KKVMCISIMMHDMSQSCNAIQSLLGIFLHLCNTSEAVIQTLALHQTSVCMVGIMSCACVSAR